MELFMFLITVFIVLPLTFPFITFKLASYCLSFYLKRKHSISLNVAKCGLLSFRGISVTLPQRPDTSRVETETQESKNLVITIDSLRLSSLYLDRSCKSLLSICAGNVAITNTSSSSNEHPIKIGLIEFRMDKIRSDFLKYYKENFNIAANDIHFGHDKFVYRIEKLVILKESTPVSIFKLDFNRVIVSDLSIPEVKSFSEMPEELKNQRIIYIDQLDANYASLNRNLTLLAIGDCLLQWSIEYHLSCINMYKYYHQTFKSIVSKPQDSNCDKTFEDKASSRSPFILKLLLNDRLSIGASISKDQTVCVEAQSLEVSASFPGYKTFSSKSICIYSDEHSILSSSDVRIIYNQAESTFNFNRQQNSCGIPLKDEINGLLSVEIESVNVLFPYNYDFATAFNEKFMGIVKWLKIYHKKKDSKPSDSIGFDMNFKINRFSLEIEDDPFEMRLRNNYMLLEDEYHEQLKRDQTLQEKISELKRTNLMLASSIVDELNRALAKKNSDIYIQRSKQLYSTENKQVPLFTVVIEEADLKFIADSNFHKHEDLKPKIKSLDPSGQINSDIQFSTLWCRIVSANFKNAEVSLRDFQMSMIGAKDLTIKGTILGTEQVAVSRARRDCLVYVGRNSEPQVVERSMTPMKFFHDLQLRCTLVSYTHGPCWEPVLQQVSLAFEKIVSASKDPSLSLSWWDKMRFIFHGSVKLNCNQFCVALHASNDPYNQTELIELCLFRTFIESTTGKIQIKGDFDALLHTASKYDECRFVHIPNIDIIIRLDWNCLGNPNDHFTIMPCAPDKVPDYSSHHNHDSYRSFRSQSLNMSLNIETQFNSPTSSINPENMPSIRFFGSTIRWLESQKFIFVGPSKLTRRGKLFCNTKPRKPSFSRIFRSVRVNISLNRFQILYWSSVSKRHGIHILGGELTHSSEHTLDLITNNTDGLKHRQQPNWQTVGMKSSLSNVEIWLYNLGFEDLDEFNEFDVQKNLKNRQYFLSFNRVSYSKEAPVSTNDPDLENSCNESLNRENTNTDSQSIQDDDCVPNHKMIIYDLKGAWTKENRDVVFGIYDAFMKNLQLKRNLSTEALKPIRPKNQNQNQHQQQQSNIATNSPPHRHQRHPSTASIILTTAASPVSSVSKNRAVSMLHKLIADSENNPTVYTEESHGGVTSETHLYGVEACQAEDIVYVKCLIELVNSQVVLCGTETPGYVIVSASNTEIRQSIHVPVWKNRTLLSKTTWIGSLKSMQYYATVDSQSHSQNTRSIFTNESDIQWLEPDNIDGSRNIFSDYMNIIKGSQKVGGVISSVVGLEDRSNGVSSGQIQLQRIISRCNCLFYFAKHTTGVAEELQNLIPPLPDDDIFIEPWDKEVGVDSFTLTHQDLDISTNSQQYAIVMDIINNLLLHVEPHKKDAFEQQERMRFRFQLSSDDDQREPISELQDQVRKYVSYLRHLERERYLVYRASIDDTMMSEVDPEYRRSLNTLSMEIRNVKEQLNSSSEQLAMMINCYKETLLGAHKAQEQQQSASQHGTGAFFANVLKRNEICFKSARWRVTDSDGQLGLADIVLNNFLYSKVAKSDDSVEHTIELGHLHVSNLIPNQHYKNVLHPTELQANIPLDRQRALRVYCRELAPVGGIPVKEHLEVNVVPFTIEITLQFFQKMVKFFFPEKDAVEKEKTKKGNDTLSEHQPGIFSKKRGKDKGGSGVGGENSSASNVGNGSGSSHTNPLMSHGNGGSARNLEDTISTMSTATMSSTATGSSVSMNQRRGDDIEKMRERASKNHTFVYVKIPGIPIKVSYKGKKQKNVTDLKNMSLTLPTYEYHNSTRTWLDLLMAVKNDSKHTVIKQALKQKMKIRPSSLWSKSNTDHQTVSNDSSSKEKPTIPVTDEDKARLLLGQYAKGWRVDVESPKSTSDTTSIDSEISR